MFDLAQMKSERQEQGADLTLKHPTTGAPIEGWTITLVGKDSHTYQTITQQLADKRLKDTNLRKGKLQIRSADMIRDGIDVLVACTRNWQGLVLEGENYPYSENNARKLYTEHAWIKEQVEEFIEDRANFLGNS